MSRLLRALRRAWPCATLATVAMLTALATAGSAWAFHTSEGGRYHSGWLTSGEGRNYGPDGCAAYNVSEMAFTVGTGGYGLARIINHATGAVIFAEESQDGYAFAYTDIANTSYKSNCRNSTPWQITYWANCDYRRRVPDGQCI